MDRRIISEKLDSLSRSIARINQKLPNDAATLKNDFDVQDIISVNLERAIQQCIDIASHLLADFDDVAGQSAASLFDDLVSRGVLTNELGTKLGKAVGFRNLLVHRYASIDWERVFISLTSQMNIFSDFAQVITKYVRL